MPRQKRVALRNLQIAFPHETPQWRNAVYYRSLRSLARLIVDFARLPLISEEWIKEHVDVSALDPFCARKKRDPERAIIFATGHLGSFELLGHVMPLIGFPIAFVVRNFGLDKIDRWWTSQRERIGNKVISRKGAFKEITRTLAAGVDTAVLFDQNVTRNHAVFVDWFGKKAATTRAVALAAIRSRAPVFLVGIHNRPNDTYRVVAKECDFDALYADDSIAFEQKVEILTQTISAGYEEFIRAQPDQWFWVHRRWKTRPEGEEENVYRDC